MRLDARKTLDTFYNEWEDCTRCSLGERRTLDNSEVVFGEGAHRGIMFIGEYPGQEEERTGHPLAGEEWKLMHLMLQKLNILDVSYFTNTVFCRSCKQMVDEKGEPRLRIIKGISYPWYKDQPPLPIHTDACRPRLCEEIYIVDPVVIVALGGGAAAALTQKASFSIMSQAGQEQEILVPGVTQRQVRTPKKDEWVRKIKGEMVAPTERYQVRYLCIPTFAPSFVLRSISDKSGTSPLRQFFNHLRATANTYIRMTEYYGIQTSVQPRMDVDIDDMWDEVEETRHADKE